MLEPEAFQQEIDRVIQQTEELLVSGQSVAVYTRRERLDLGKDRQEEELKLSVKISDAVTSIVSVLQFALSISLPKVALLPVILELEDFVKRAAIAGQIKPGIPVWQTGEDSKFPFMSYVIFPGNVGSKGYVKEAVDILEG
ncbi:hypothetical protein ACEQPO_29085 [Bacillus sp. SL00103]